MIVNKYETEEALEVLPQKGKNKKKKTINLNQSYYR